MRDRFLSSVCLAMLLRIGCLVSWGDRGMIPLSNVSVYSPGQKAIIGWCNREEILILSTDVYGSGEAKVLEVLPLPSKPARIEKADFKAFLEVERLIKFHAPRRIWRGPLERGRGAEVPGVEILFHKKIGAHDITVAKANDVKEFTGWVENFLKKEGLEYETPVRSKLNYLIRSYILKRLNYFVFDLIEVSKERNSLEPIFYQFKSNFLYFPLRISALASGPTSIQLFLFTRYLPDVSPDNPDMPLKLGYWYIGVPMRFEVTGKEMEQVDKRLSKLVGGKGWFTALRYDGALENLVSDLRISRFFTGVVDYGTRE